MYINTKQTASKRENLIDFQDRELGKQARRSFYLILQQYIGLTIPSDSNAYPTESQKYAFIIGQSSILSKPVSSAISAQKALLCCNELALSKYLSSARPKVNLQIRSTLTKVELINKSTI